MKSTGMVRQLDTLGRIVIPVELSLKDTLEIFVDGDQIVLKKYHPACVFCNDARDVISYKGKLVCRRCLAELRSGEL